MRRAVFTICALFAVSACNNQPAAPAATPAAAPAAKKLGIRPDGDTEIKPDLSQVPPELQKVYAATTRISAYLTNTCHVVTPSTT